MNDGHADLSNIPHTVDHTLPPGCAAVLRQWEGKDSWNVDTVFNILLQVVDNKAAVLIDSSNAGEWIPCVENVDVSHVLPLSEHGWHVGVTAATGQLHDNHDVLSLTVYNGEAPATASVEAAPQWSTGSEEQDAAIRSAIAEERARAQVRASLCSSAHVSNHQCLNTHMHACRSTLPHSGCR